MKRCCIIPRRCCWPARWIVVEQSGGSAMLRRLSAIFQSLTHGLYSHVVSEPDDNGKSELVMIQRDFPEERQHIDQLSEGTRDQLFLALRVAAIEDHLRTAEPLPFIGDDILQTFDDDRGSGGTACAHRTQRSTPRSLCSRIIAIFWTSRRNCRPARSSNAGANPPP